MSSICGAVGEYDSSTVRKMSDSLRKEGQRVDVFEDQGIVLVGLHENESNIANDDLGEVHSAIAGDVFVRLQGKNDVVGYGSRIVANAWATCKEGISGLADGAFVSVIFDSKNSKCYAFNDFIGQVPLFYAHFGGATYFASELRAFLQSESLPTFIDPRGLRLFFSFGCVPGSRSILGGVRKILPASFVCITPNTIQERKYWRIGEARTVGSRSLNATIDGVESSLLTSIERRLGFAENPIGVLLGGLDSSIITALLRRLSREKITAVTALFDDSRFNERGAKQVASENDVDLLEVPVNHNEIPKMIEDMVEAFDEPVSDMVASPIAFALMRKSQGVAKTFFEGTGADDLFQGIPRELHRLDFAMNRFPDGLASKLRKGTLLSAIPGIQGILARKRFDFLVSPSEREVISWRQMSDERAGSLITVQGAINRRKEERLHKRRTDNVVAPILSEIQQDLSGARLDPGGITVKTAVSLYFVPAHGFDCSRNRALSSKYRVKVISPYYDRTLYDIGLSVPWYYKIPSEGLSKPLLRRVAIQKKLLPKDVALLGKMGLGSSRQSLVDTQMKLWAKGELSNWISETIIESFGIVKHLLNKGEVFTLIRNGKPSQIFEILSFILWYKRYFGDLRVPMAGRSAAPVSLSA